MILGQGVEHEFNPGGDPQFLENLEQIILDGMLAKLQLLGNLAVRQAVGYQGDNFFFALREQTASASIDYPKGARRHQLFKNVIHLNSVPALTHYEDRNSGAHSLEVRHPFLDHRLVNFVVNLPTELKIHRGWTKYILRAALPEMPPALRWRRDKQGFLVPEQLWLRRELVPVIRRRFRGSILAELGILNDKKFLQYYDRFLTGNSIASADIARVLIAEIWAGQVFQSGTSRTQIGHQPTSLGMQPAVCQ